MDYLEWNDLIASYFFSPEKDGSRVFLYVTAELIHELNADNPGALNDFINAAMSGPHWAKPNSGFCQKALQAFDNWRDRGLKYPPYITSLAFFVLAAGHEGNFASHAYYPRLWKLLDQDKTGPPPSFSKMYILWDDLERWSQYDMKGAMGIFHTYLSGDWIHVGLPTAQTILTEEELRSFPQVFANAELDPTADLSDDELFSLLFKHGSQYFRPVTLQFLRHPNNVPAELKNLFGDVFQDHLHSWSGHLDQQVEQKRNTTLYASLVLCCRQIDPVAGRFIMEIRCKAAFELPEEGFTAKVRFTEDEYEIVPSIMPWSSPLRDSEGGNLNPASIDWTRTFSMRDEPKNIELRMRGKMLRIFVAASRWGLPGYLEVDRICGHEAEFYFLVHDSVYEKIREWGENGGCKEFNVLKFKSGLPAQWTAVKVNTVLSDAGIKADFPSLAATDAIRIRFQHGIRVGNGNTYFDFARPSVFVDSGNEIESVSCGGITLSKNSNGIYALPENLECAQRHMVEVKSGGQVITRKSIALEKSFPLTTEVQCFDLDKFGTCSARGREGEVILSGAFVAGLNTPKFIFTTILELSDMACKSVILLGKEPGEVEEWPSNRNLDWQPVWAIISKGRRDVTAVFCGTDLESSYPGGAVRTYGGKEVKRWKELLWYRRKRIGVPKNTIERNLWRQYVNKAKDV